MINKSLANFFLAENVLVTMFIWWCGFHMLQNVSAAPSGWISFAIMLTIGLFRFLLALDLWLKAQVLHPEPHLVEESA